MGRRPAAWPCSRMPFEKALRSVVSRAEASRRNGLLRLEARELHDRGPAFGLVSDELGKVCRGSAGRGAAQVRHALLDRGIGNRRVDLLVEERNDFGGRALRRTQPTPTADLVARQEL